MNATCLPLPGATATPRDSAAPYQVHAVVDMAQWDALHAEWQDLSASSPTATVFNTFEWTRACWQHLHARQPAGHRPALWLLAVRQHGRLCALAPLWLHTEHVLGMAVRVARWIGDGPTDYGDLLLAAAPPAAQQAAVNALLDHLLAADAPCQVIDLRECRAESPALAWLRDGLRQRGAYTHEGDDSPCCATATAGGWEAYAERQFSAQRRKGFRREARRLQEAGGISWQTLTTPEQLDGLAPQLARVQAAQACASTGRPGEFNDPVIRPYMDAVLAAGAQRGWLRAYVLRRDGELLAYLIAFAFRDRFYLYNTGHTSESQRWGAGKQVILHGLRCMFDEADAATVDFLRGAYDYKQMLTEHATTNRRLQAARPGAPLAAWCWFTLRPALANNRAQRLLGIARAQGPREVWRRLLWRCGVGR